MTELEKRQQVVDIMAGWVGATKGSAAHREILSLYNGRYPIARGYAVQEYDDYCATTVSAAFIKAGIAEYTGTECGVERFVEVAKEKGIWIEDDAFVPQFGDAIVYDWQDTGVGDSQGWADHIGIVAAVNGNLETVIEGNMSGGVVGTRSIEVNARYIRGYICPDYAKIVGVSTVSPSVQPLPQVPLQPQQTHPQTTDLNYEMFKSYLAKYRGEVRDNDASAYSEEARIWSVAMGLIAGGGNGADGKPNYMWEDFLTREQFVTVLYRFAKIMGRA